mmetsp:Transcript_11258/g.25242  ORF Transcript_11258/g.25242 Transcript_11258/m.25242 type:complete len:166 (-) Transcript_11258:398-895(-)
MMKSLHMNILSLQGMTCHGLPSNIGAIAAEDENGGIQRAQAACRIKVAKSTPLHSSAGATRHARLFACTLLASRAARARRVERTPRRLQSHDDHTRSRTVPSMWCSTQVREAPRARDASISAASMSRVAPFQRRCFESGNVSTNISKKVKLFEGFDRGSHISHSE